MNTVAKRCKCGNGLLEKRVVTPAGVVQLGLCPLCDRPKCSKCKQTYGRFFVGRGAKCETCGHRN